MMIIFITHDVRKFVMGTTPISVQLRTTLYLKVMHCAIALSFSAKNGSVDQPYMYM